MAWFFTNGMHSIFPHQNNEEVLSQPLPEPEGDVGDLGYVSDAVVQARMVRKYLYLFNISFYFIYELYFT